MKVKQIISLIIILIFALSLSAKSDKVVKLKQSQTVASIVVNLERMIRVGDGTIVEGKIRQNKNFSYSISMENCEIILPNGKTYSGEILEWNDKRDNRDLVRTISDEETEKFSMFFPKLQMDDCSEFDLYFGTLLNRNKTAIIFKDIKLKKK